MSLRSAYPLALGGSAALHQRAAAALAGAASHDSWRLEPFAPVFASARGAYKQDVDGRSYVDLWMGHGSLLLGHGDEEVVVAVREQTERAGHLSGLTIQMIAWAEVIKSLISSADRVRFTASGSEAAHLAFRVARAYTGRPIVVRLGGHYHGWHENLLAGVVDPAAIGMGSGRDVGVAAMDADDLDAIDRRFAQGDVAALILEPGGGGSGALPWSPGHLSSLRALADRYGVLLVFDEVISGFRYSPGGVQALARVKPDLTILAKIMAGGWPGGALVGAVAPMSVFSPGVSRPHGQARVVHAGTFNGFAPSAAAGVVTLRRISDGEAQRRADRAAQRLCAGVNAVAAARGFDAGMFQNSSTVHLVLGAAAAGVELRASTETFGLVAGQAEAYGVLRRHLLISGIDMHATHGWLSEAHDDAVIDEAIERFDRAFAAAASEGHAASYDLATCSTVCHVPTCASRNRTFADCDLPLADANEEHQSS